ncbi:MAG TPA: outer membrane beta-barrel protein [Pyrinomonadaceae bacterium]|nr:outer membrane beta-barrel protein [Pyrinomonadaceae bacterium]
MRLKLLVFVSVTGIVFLSMVVAQAQSSTAVPPLVTLAPSSAPSPAASPAEPSKTEEPRLTDREKALLDRVDQLEKRLAEIEGVIKKPTAEPPAIASTKPPATADPASTSTPEVSPAVPPVQDKPKKSEPFAFADWSWMTGNARTKDVAADSKFFTPEIRFDVNYTSSFNHPNDNTIGGSSEIFRSGEVQLTQLGLGGDFHYDNVRGRVMTQIGMYSQTQPRNDISVARGQWGLDNAYRYISEAYGGYHIDKMHGINVDAGIFLSYIGLWSFYNFDNWTYQPSFVSSNTPWFFNGLRVQIFPSDKLKIEPWLINGWQSYGKFNKAPGVGGQIAWRPNGKVAFVFNNYYGADTLGVPNRKRFHTDDSVQVKYYDNKDSFLDKAAFSFTADVGCESGGGVSCHSSKPGAPAQYFIGFMAYNRFWFKHDKFGLTLGGGAINNPGRYLVLLPPINGATAITGTPYFTENPGDPFKGLDGSVTFDYMPSQYITFRMEYNHRASNVPYWSGKGGITPPSGNTGPLGSFVPGFTPDLRKEEKRYTMAILVKW